MPEKSAQEKTEKPTPRRRRKAREEGRVARSSEITSVGVLGAGMMSLVVFGGYIYHNLTNMMRHIFVNAPTMPMSVPDMHNFSMEIMAFCAKLLAPALAAVALAAMLFNLAQVGFLFAPKRLKPDMSRLNFFTGLKRFVSLRMLVDLFKNVGKLVVVGAVAYLTVAAELNNLTQLVDMETRQILDFIVDISFKIFWRSLLAMLVLALLDWAYQKWDFEKNLKMTKQELKDEFKQTEGDPKVKSRIRSIQLDQARKRMMTAVPTADVVITNPTRLAVALLYKVGEMESPQVVAKGANKLADRIRELAQEAGVPLIEDKPLAQTLYKAVEVGHSIPYELYEAVATILAHVYRQKNRHQQVLRAQRGRA